MTEDRSQLGQFEQLAMLAILQLGDRAYAVPIREEIGERADRSVSRGALYTTLQRLEDKGYLASTMADPAAERGGRPRRYFSVTDEGMEALRHARRVLLSFWRGLEARLDERAGT